MASRKPWLAAAPGITVTDTEAEPDHVEVGHHGTGHARHPYPLWRDWAVETGAYAKGRDRM